MAEVGQQNEHSQGPFRWSGIGILDNNTKDVFVCLQIKCLPVVEEQIGAVNKTRIEAELTRCEVQAQS